MTQPVSIYRAELSTKPRWLICEYSYKLRSRLSEILNSLFNNGRSLAHKLCPSRQSKFTMIQRVVQQENNILNRFVHLKLLKECPEVMPILAEWEYNDWHEYDRTLTKEKLIDGFKQTLNDNRLPLTLVAFEGTDPIGMISLEAKGEPEFSYIEDGNPWGGSFHVTELQRKKGVGEILASTATKIAKALGHKKIHFYTSNPEIVKWYTSRNAEITGSPDYRGHKVTTMQFLL